MTKIVLQIPEDDDNYELLSGLRVVGDRGPHGPHIMSDRKVDAETGENVLHVRVKRDTTKEAVEALLALLVSQ